MTTRLERLARRIDANLDRLLETLRAMTPEQRSFEPGGDAWSVNQVAHHLLLVQSISVGVMEKNRGRQSARRNLRQRLGRIGVAMVLGLGIKVRNPAPPTTPDPEITFEELEPRWSEERARFGGLVASMDDASLGEAGFKHPISGPLTVGESLDFLACHLEHHLKQIERIRALPGFPAA